MKILIVEDDPLHRSYLHEQVISALPECHAVFEATQGLEAETLAREHRDAHIVMDLQMARRNGIESARTIWRENPTTRILFWSNYSDEAYVRGVSRIVPNGAAYGYVLKSASEERLRLALRSIFIENQCVIDNEVRGTQQRSFANADGFSDSEYEILVDVAIGMTDRAISERRKLSLRSVQNRLQQIYGKLDVHHRFDTSHGESDFNLRSRAVSVALLRKLLNYGAIERAEAELLIWMRGRTGKAVPAESNGPHK
jgi:DNA-binding NarL/FixJ family response regulator